VNVKVPEFLLDIIDENIEDAKVLKKAGYQKRAHFVIDAVVDKLLEFGLLSPKDIEILAEKKARRDTRKKRKTP
jgi:hypothetical protein